MANISINPKFKAFCSRSWFLSKLIYLILIHALLLFYSPFIQTVSDETGTMITIDIPIVKINKTILLQNE